jgi:hypothetical protein
MMTVRGLSQRRVAAACVFALLGAAGAHRVPAQTSAPVVYVIAIEGMIDLGLAPFLARTIREAHAAGAAAVLLPAAISSDAAECRLRALDSGEARSEPVTETESSVTMTRQI